MSCCEPPDKPAPCCGGTESACCGTGRKFDWLLWGSMALVVAGLVGHFLGTGPRWWLMFSHANFEFMRSAWWGILTGIVAVGVIGQLPRDLVSGLLGKGGTVGGILRATFAGTLLDLCNHGVLMIGAQLYRKGASLGQTLAFLISSPWNSLSVTLILAALIGWKWMLVFMGLSMAIGILTGWIADLLVARGHLPGNPNARELPEDFRFGPAFREALSAIKPTPGNLKRMALSGIHESSMILRWIFFGIVMAGAIRALVPDLLFATWFGPSLVGLLLTLVATTLIEVCTEGSSPIAADLLTRAAAPGNAFAFLMAGAATDYTEMMVLRQTTGSWKATLALPFLTIPQVLVVAWLLNGGG